MYSGMREERYTDLFYKENGEKQIGRGYDMETESHSRCKRPLLLITSSADSAGVRAASALGDKVPGPHQVSTIQGTGVGPALIRVDPQLEGTIVGWIASGGVDASADPGAAAVKVGDTTTLETKGTRIGEQP